MLFHCLVVHRNLLLELLFGMQIRERMIIGLRQELNAFCLCKLPERVKHLRCKLLELLKGIEKELGRQERDRWGPREIDIDLLFYGDQIVSDPDLVVPHPQMQNRAFVLIPLAQVAPGWRHPCLGKDLAELAADLEDTGDLRILE